MPREQETYGHVVYSSKTKGIVALDTAAGADFLIDPVAFAYDFGARMYDARLGRWLSMDPLGAKYPNLSPYNFVGNSPILYVDYDGRDYGVYINHKTQTIVIKANIYTTKAYSRESNSASMNTYNRAILIKKYYENIKAQYIVKNESGEEVVYNVSFEINVGKPEGNRRVAMEKTRADSEGNMFNASLAGERNTSPNTGEFTGMQPMRDEDTGELRMINKLGFTEPFDLIFVEGTNDEKPNKWNMTDLHEFGHVLLSLVQYFHDQDGTFTLMRLHQEHRGMLFPLILLKIFWEMWA